MFNQLRKRAAEQEIMDDFSLGGGELREALRHLRRLNFIFGAAAPTCHGVAQLWREAGKPKSLSILDIGSGSGDVNRQLLRWAEDNRVALTITLADITEEACEEARHLFRGEPGIQIIRSDLFALPAHSADIVTATQFVHHFSAHEVPRVVQSMLKTARLGVVINDIHRHWIPWAAVWLTTRMISRNRYILHDGPLSVAKGFRGEDWQQLRTALGLSYKMDYAWRPLFRYVVVIRNSQAN
ncbi:methyltransferase domain-containing protein [Paenibacillus sp. GCM10027626]|uniref:methyltransferase domain-containing protein n=1 Tax=Paenibacillus sp. GCM10027626 TaxID=3273411 RepID=UPI00363730D3